MRYFRSLTMQILLGLIMGCLAGVFFEKNVAVLGELGKIIITMIKAVATPLLFFVILHAILSTEISHRSGMKLITICAFNSVCALSLGIGLSELFRAGESLSKLHSTLVPPEQLAMYAGKKISVMGSLQSYFPESLAKPFVENSVISLILIALCLGFALKKIKKAAHGEELAAIAKLTTVFSIITKTLEISLGWLVRLAPLAVFGVTAKTVGEFGFTPLRGLAQYVGVGLLGLFLHIALVYQAWLVYKGVNLKFFWKTVRETLIYSIGVNSSLATLPLTLKTLHRLGVSQRASTLGACVGTNLNNDGILLYEGMAVFFVAQAAGIHMTFSTQLLSALACVMGTIGIAGIPEAGFITLTLVLTTVGLPTEILPMLLTVDWILGRARTVVNVMGDITVSIAIDSTENSTLAKETNR